MSKDKGARNPPDLLEYFLSERLQAQRQASRHTVSSYRDTFRLLVTFNQETTGRAPAQQRWQDWDAPQIIRFLDHLEKQRGCQPRTRNARLAAIRSFMRVAAQQEPSALALASRVLAIPMKRFDRPSLGFLSREELQKIVATPNPNCWNGRRDRMLFGLLYNTGARVSEILDLQRKDIQWHPICLVELHGKGRKQRSIPLWKSTATQLQQWLEELPEDPHTPVFLNRFGRQLTRFGVTQRLRLTVKSASQTCVSLKGRAISPHTFRHSTAMHLLQAKVDIAVIALLLGHENPSTTHHYIELDLEMKERCLEKLNSPVRKSKRFKPNDRLLEFLENL